MPSSESSLRRIFTRGLGFRAEVSRLPLRERGLELAVDAVAVLLKAVGLEGLRDLETAEPLAWLGERLHELVERARSRVSRVDGRFVERLQERVQEALGKEKRRRKSAYYTVEAGRKLMVESLALHGDAKTVADPFMGSGLLLTEAVKRVGVDEVGKVWGVEVEPLPCMVGYAALLHLFGGDPSRLDIRLGDAFDTVAEDPGLRAEAVLSNPPFVRWETLDEEARRRVKGFVERYYGDYLSRRQLNLSVAGFFLLDHVLRRRGFLATVLPASTFYTIVGEGVKKILMERYGVLALVRPARGSSFSSGSGFEELILLATKGELVEDTMIILLDDSRDPRYALHRSLGSCRLHSIPQILNHNWLSLFADPWLRELLAKLSNSPLLAPGSQVISGRILRGVEMYGPDFFLLPNRFWRVVGEEEGCVELEGDGGRRVRVGRKYLVKTLRRPALYGYKMLVEPAHYFLSIPPKPIHSLPQELRAYLKWGASSSAASPAMRAFGKLWYAHIWRQLRSKGPYGGVFIPDKVEAGLTTRGVFSNHSLKPFTAAKNFYILRGLEGDDVRLAASWFNSVFFIIILTVAGRRISRRWTRLLEEDHLRLPFPRLEEVRGSGLEEIVEKNEGRELPPLLQQLENPPSWRLKMDAIWLELLRIKDVENLELYENLSHHLKIKS